MRRVSRGGSPAATRPRVSNIFPVSVFCRPTRYSHMVTDSLFKVLPAAGRGGTSAVATVTITFDGRTLHVLADVSVAAALLASGVDRLRSTPGSGAPGAPYCMMGVGFGCLVDI